MANELVLIPEITDAPTDTPQPARVGGTKTNRSPVAIPTKQVSAQEHNNRGEFIRKLAVAVGLGDGSTAGSLEQRGQLGEGLDEGLAEALEASTFTELGGEFSVKIHTLALNKVTVYDFSGVTLGYVGGPWVWILVLPPGAEGDRVTLLQGLGTTCALSQEFLDGGGYMALSAGTLEAALDIDGSASPIPFTYLQTKFGAYGVRMLLEWRFQGGQWRTVQTRIIGGVHLLGSASYIGGASLSEGSLTDGNVLTVNSGGTNAYFQALPVDGPDVTPTLRTLGTDPNQAYPGPDGLAAATAASDAAAAAAAADITANLAIDSLLSGRGRGIQVCIASGSLDGNLWFWDVRPVTAGANISMTLPASPGSGLDDRLMLVRGSAWTTTIVRPGPSDYINDNMADLVIPALAQSALFRVLFTSFGTFIHQIGKAPEYVEALEAEVASNTSAVAQLELGFPAGTVQVISSGTTATVQAGKRVVLIATGSGAFTLTARAIHEGDEVEIIKTSTDANSITYARAGAETIQGVGANFLLPGSTSTVGYVAWTARDVSSVARVVS